MDERFSYTGLPPKIEPRLYGNKFYLVFRSKRSSAMVHTAEQSLERNWRKFFGDRRAPFTSLPGRHIYAHGIGLTSASCLKNRHFSLQILKDPRINTLETQVNTGSWLSEQKEEQKDV
ncbi:hypothetical protein ElyMa_001629700 [Elysia marginata]|uniref:Uncharacterized protein n=1 Tax=Elysia marginata TaxID=1093978 RepID=A0AAV4JLP3_9GAST|nr:hypothetical protein ElyMa_001629700 [Elysia marginata]